MCKSVANTSTGYYEKENVVSQELKKARKWYILLRIKYPIKTEEFIIPWKTSTPKSENSDPQKIFSNSNKRIKS